MKFRLSPGLKKKTLFTLAAVFLFIVTMEAAGYVLFYAKYRKLPHQLAQDEFHNRMEYNFFTDHPYLPFVARDVTWKGRAFNSLGGRGPEPETPKRRIRVICFGGSTTLELDQEDEQTWVGQLRKSLGDKYEVINAGQFNYTSMETLINLSLLYADLQPDYVLVLDGINDLEPSYAANFRPDYAHCRRKIPDVPYPIFTRLPDWLEYSSLYTQLKLAFLGHRGNLSWLFCRPGSFIDLRGNRLPAGLGTFRRNLLHIHAVCAVHGAKLILGTPPYFKAMFERAKGNAMANAWQYGIDAENGIIRDIASRVPRVYLAEIAKSFRPTEEEMWDYCHLTEKGNVFVSRAFYKALKKAEASH